MTAALKLLSAATNSAQLRSMPCTEQVATVAGLGSVAGRLAAAASALTQAKKAAASAKTSNAGSPNAGRARRTFGGGAAGRSIGVPPAGPAAKAAGT